MDVEQIKKLNEMTKTLQKHGIAESSEDGSKIAGGITDSEVPKENTEINKEYVELMFERNNRKVMNEINALKEEILKLNKSLRAVKNQKSENVVIQEKVVKEEPKEKPKKEKKEESVKCGRDPEEIEGADVSVENIFYYGQK